MTEAMIQKAIITRLQKLKWYVKVMHGSTYQSGMPDLFATHRLYGPRLIEVKKPVGYSFTPAQISDFAQIISHGTEIYVLCGDSDTEIAKLFGLKGNYYQYLEKMRPVR